MDSIRQAFVLGAGLGKRLRPLTESVPKPMVPLWNKPLLTYAFDHLIEDAGTERFLVNTHHRAEVYDHQFPEGTYRDRTLAFRHEPVLLETAGGIANIIDWLPDGDESFFVYNGDILTDLPLGPAIEAHEKSGALVTLILRSEGSALHIAWDEASGRVIDIHNQLGRTEDFPGFQFTGLYLVRPTFLRFLTPGKIESVIWPFLKAIEEGGGNVGGVVIDEGSWMDLGTRQSYLEASVALAEDPSFPRYGRRPEMTRIDSTAEIETGALVDGASVVGPGCRLAAGSELTRSILWSDCSVSAGARVESCIARNATAIDESASELDF